MIFYTNFLVPGNSAAITLGFIILIRPQYKGDVGLIKHEQVHVKQFWKSWCTFPVMYILSKKYRLAAEVEAYREQLRYYPDDRSKTFARYIANNYVLNISETDALKLLK